jgi:hypothetical protein
MNRLETLLEAAIDKHFDLFEIYVLRNTFAVKTELIPFIELRHQVSHHVCFGAVRILTSDSKKKITRFIVYVSGLDWIT